MQLSEINLETIRRPSSSRQASWWARVCFAMSHRWFCKVQSHHWRAKRSADNLRLVCSCCWTTSFNKTNSNKHRRTSRVADLNDSENMHSFQPTNTHHTHGFPYSSFQWFSAVSVLSVEWTLWCPTCVVMWLDWNGALESVFLISIPGTEWLVHRPCPEKHWRAFDTWQNAVVVYDFMGKF